jgi:hypothetical protein
LFIVGSPRSGTTLLTHLVNRFLDFHICRDSGILLRFSRLQSHYGDLSDDASLRRLLEDMYGDFFFRQRFLQRGLTLTAEQLIESLKERTYPALARHILRVTATAHGKSGWGNKKPSYALDLAEVARIFPEARFVHIVRDGRDVALSMRRATDNLFEQNWYFAARDWRVHVLEARRMGRALGPQRYLELKYEYLLSEPFAALTALLEFVDADVHARKLLTISRREIEGAVRPGNFDKWRREMPHRAQRVVEMAAGDALETSGYPLMFPELRGRRFSPVHLWLFSLDRLGRKIYGRDLQKALFFRAQWLLTGLRVRTRHSRLDASDVRQQTNQNQS